MKFNGAIEFITNHRAVISLTIDGELVCAGRIDLPRGNRADLYELGFIRLTATAEFKGGTLDTYRVES